MEGKGRIVAVLEPATELAVQGRIGQIRDVVTHARDGEPALRIGAFGEIAPMLPFRVGHHRLAADLVEGDVLRRIAARGRAPKGRRKPPTCVQPPLVRPLHYPLLRRHWEPLRQYPPV